MLFAAEGADHSISVALITAIGAVFGILLGGVITFIIERYKIRAAMRGAAEREAEIRKDLLDRRLAALDSDPGNVVTWDNIKEHVRGPQ